MRTVFAGLVVVMLSALPAVAQPALPPSGAASTLDAEAIAALDRMGATLRGMSRFQVRSDATVERVYENGQKLQYLMRTTYLVDKPDRMMVDLQSDDAHRRIFYDGKAMTLVGLKARKYVRFPVSGSIANVLERAEDDYGIDFPLRDLFLWGADEGAADRPETGFRVGDAMIGDTPVDHYAFRQSGTDWQIWLEKGDRPLPRKMVVTRTDVVEQPQYVAYFTWDTAPNISANAFNWKPDANYQLIDFGTAALADKPSR